MSERDDRIDRLLADPEAYFREARKRAREELQPRRVPLKCRLGFHGTLCHHWPQDYYTCNDCGRKVRR